jgi:hypothetical protein
MSSNLINHLCVRTFVNISELFVHWQELLSNSPVESHGPQQSQLMIFIFIACILIASDWLGVAIAP